jgi:hypothetical protein
MFVLPFLLVIFSVFLAFGVILPLIGVLVITRSKTAASVLFLVSGIAIIASACICVFLFFDYSFSIPLYYDLLRIQLASLVGGVLHLVGGILTATHDEFSI